MMVCMAALFMLGYVNSCDSGADGSITKLKESPETHHIVG